MLRPGLALSALLVASAHLAEAQETVETLVPGPSGEAYLESVGRRVDSAVTYYDPTRPAPELDISRAPEPEDQPDPLSRADPAARTGLAVLAALILGALLLAVMRLGGGATVAFRAAPSQGDAKRRQNADPRAVEDTALPGLDAILRMSDRKAALIAMATTVLVRAVESHGLRWQASWTVRDALRRLPENQPGMDALRRLVLASEHAHFGDRAVTAADFDAHLEAIRPLVSELRT